ncbi:GyrI-like domain-containing protein [Patescibacteria group bacterium]|nr:GyrI-like domain-containing protein [Patescibacteria group bacterium]MBU1682419.1 GyrI-like domain-containing protein [Patescibacteria group bacterium]MBU1935103.1 GyrI-like domain-containing protein [Patescibacteria group bacterium]
MNKILKILIVIVLVVLGLLAYMGFFNTITFTEGESGPYTFVYEDFVGEYAETGPLFDEIYESLVDNGIETELGLGIYYDNPDEVDASELRSRVGSVVTEEQAQLADEAGVPYKIMTVDPINAVITEFPYRNMLSYMVGPMKVYPKMTEYIAEKGYGAAPCYELYDMENNKIFYMCEIVSK